MGPNDKQTNKQTNKQPVDGNRGHAPEYGERPRAHNVIRSSIQECIATVQYLGIPASLPDKLAVRETTHFTVDTRYKNVKRCGAGGQVCANIVVVRTVSIRHRRV